MRGEGGGGGCCRWCVLGQQSNELVEEGLVAECNTQSVQ